LGTLAIIAHIVLLAAMLRKRFFPLLLVFIVIFGMAGTPLLHYGLAHFTKLAYYNLYYAIDWIMALLYAFCAILMWRTRFEAIAFSMVVFLGMKAMAWYFMLLGDTEHRMAMLFLLRPMNILELVFWAMVILSVEDTSDDMPRRGRKKQTPTSRRILTPIYTQTEAGIGAASGRSGWTPTPNPVVLEQLKTVVDH